ncbi:MAG TPA: thioesterase family protein [Polyangia bacterium]|nr:thioesterase family protein [Polyangia bacterium]
MAPEPVSDAAEAPRPRAPLREVARVRVIYGDTDQMGMVYYANYLRYFEIARNEYLRVAGQTYRAFEESHGLMLPVVEAHVSYHKPARYDDDLGVWASCAGRGAASVRFEYELRRGGERLVSGHTIHACVTREGRVVRLPAELRAAVGLPERA